MPILLDELAGGSGFPGANVEDSLLYHWFTRFHGIEFVVEPEIAAGLRPVQEGLGERLKISYFIPDAYFSKWKAKRTDSDGKMLMDRMDEAAIAEFGGAPFLFACNNGREVIRLEEAGGQKIPVISHGLNKYSDATNIYFSAALNREPARLKMLNDIGIGSSTIYSASACEVIYQSVMRTNLREPKSQAVVHAIVPDQFAADRVAELVGSRCIQKIGDLTPTRRKPLTVVQRRQRQRTLEDIDQILCPESIRTSFTNDFRAHFGKSSLETNSSTCIVTFHRGLYDDRPEQFSVQEFTTQDFIRTLRRWAHTPLLEKENLLFNSSLFSPPMGGHGYRKQDYFVRSSFLVLDFDGGDLSPERFEEMFGKNAGSGQRRSYIICNSFSRSAAEPNRFRVIMLYKRPAISLEQHQAVHDAIVRRLEECGHTKDSAKLDSQCRSGVHSFYIPCTNREHQEWAFFETHATKTQDLARYGIDPILYWSTSLPVNDSFISMTGEAGIPLAGEAGQLCNTPEIDAMITEIQGMREGRHAIFFSLTIKLAKHYRCAYTVEQQLRFIAGEDRKLQKKIRYNMKSLREYGWLR